MIEVYGDLCSKTRSDDFINNINNEYLQSVIQKYKFTYQDHIYEKNNKIYQYNNQTLKFDVFKTIFRPQIIFMCTNPLMKKCDIGTGEKCESCDIYKPEFCFSCNVGYYLPREDKTKCKRCSKIGCERCPDDNCLLKDEYIPENPISF